MMSARHTAVLVALLALALSDPATGYSTPNTTPPTCATSSTSTRGTFLSTAAAAGLALLVAPPLPACAKEVDPAIKGTKKDPEFELCLSKCVYDCTKPKGAEMRGRAECLPECKAKCATTKAQLLKGSPIQK